MTAQAPAQDKAAGQVDCGFTAAEVFANASPGVVQVFSLGIDQFRVVERVRTAQGSGFLLRDDLVVTNYHVIAQAQTIGVAISNQFLDARVVGSDPILDIAVLQAPALGFFTKKLELAPANEITVGQPAYVLGYPLGIGKSISAGIVPGLERIVPLNTSSWLSPFIQTDAATSAGNSGGPLLDGCGRVIGVVTLHMQSPKAENIGFAIPAATLHRLLPELIETGKVARPWHGLYGQIATPQILQLLGVTPENWTEGFLVETVEPGSAADRAGLRGGDFPVLMGMQEIILGGDIITRVNGRELRIMEDAIASVRDLEIGQTVTIRILRDGQQMEMTTIIEERPILERDLERYRLQ
jgi:putative serine protease PepD